jgi:nickel-dependent lactate racemase
LVKTPHAIEEIAASISLVDDRRVRLVREASRLAESNAEAACDPATSLRRALERPLEFPPFSASIVPGDRVAVALDESLPCIVQVARGALDALQNAGVEPSEISVVVADGDAAKLCREALIHNDNEGPHVVVHDPDDEANLCLVGVTKRGEPLLINRTIFEADVVLPIGTARLSGCGAYETLFPRFSNAAAIERYQTPASAGKDKNANGHRRETDEAGWLIGVPMVVQVVPGPSDSVAEIVAGEPAAVTRRCDELYRERWLLHSPQLVSLVIAIITGGSHAQRWENVGRALAAAENLLVDGGAVVICSNLDQPPGESLGRLIGSTDLEKTERKLLHDHGDDSMPAWHLARALQRGPVYLLSQLDAETVEDMGLAPVANLQEIVRLAQRHESCAIIEDSQHAVVSVGDIENDS